MSIDPHLPPLSPTMATYTKALIHALNEHGVVSRPASTIDYAHLWQSRMHNAARHVGFIVETRVGWDNQCVTATLVGWQD